MFVYPSFTLAYLDASGYSKNVSAATPLPVTVVGAGGVQDVNLKQLGGSALGTSLPVSGGVTVTGTVTTLNTIPACSRYHDATGATGTIYAGACNLHAVAINTKSGGGGTVTLSEGGSTIAVIDSDNFLGSMVLDIGLSSLSIAASGTPPPDVTVAYLPT